MKTLYKTMNQNRVTHMQAEFYTSFASRSGLARYLLAFLFITAGLMGHTTESRAADDDAPAFTLRDLSGNAVSLRDLTGKPILLNFWATWCAPCLHEMPDMQALHELYGEELQIVSINVGEAPADVRTFVEQNGYTWTFLLDEQDSLSGPYDVNYLPTNFVIDAVGTVLSRHEGSLSGYEMMRLAQHVLGVTAVAITPPGEPGTFAHEVVRLAQETGLTVVNADSDVVTLSGDGEWAAHEVRLEWFYSNTFEEALIEFRIASIRLDTLTHELREDVLVGLMEANPILSRGAWGFDGWSDQLMLIDTYDGAMLNAAALRRIVEVMAKEVGTTEREMAAMAASERAETA